MDLFKVMDDSQSLWSIQKAAPTIDENPPVVDLYESNVGSSLLSQPPLPTRKKHKEKRGKGPETSKPSKGFGLGLSRGFQLWRALGSIRRCISRVSEPLSKVQRRSLRRRLTYHVDDLERIFVGVNPQDPYCSSDDTVSGDEELRDEVNALIEDALDEAALQGKVVQTDYFETRVSFLEQQCSTLKRQLEEIASKKFVQETSERQGESSLKPELVNNEPRRGRCSDAFFSLPKGDFPISNDHFSASGSTHMEQRIVQSDVSKSNVGEDIIQSATQKQEGQLQAVSTKHPMQPGQEVQNICNMEQQEVHIHTNTNGYSHQELLAQIQHADTESHDQKYKHIQEQVKDKFVIQDESAITHTMQPGQQKKKKFIKIRLVDKKMMHAHTKKGSQQQEPLALLEQPAKASHEQVGKHIQKQVEEKCDEQAKIHEKLVAINHAPAVMHSNKLGKSRKSIVGNCQTQNQPKMQFVSIKKHAGPQKIKKILKKVSQVSLVSQPINEQPRDQQEGTEKAGMEMYGSCDQDREGSQTVEKSLKKESEDESKKLCTKEDVGINQHDQISFVSQPINEQPRDQQEGTEKAGMEMQGSYKQDRGGSQKVGKLLKKESEDESKKLCTMEDVGINQVQHDQISFVSQPINEQPRDQQEGTEKAEMEMHGSCEQERELSQNQVEDESETHGEGINEEQIDPPSNEAQSDQSNEGREALTGDGQTTNQLQVQGVPIKGKGGRAKRRKKTAANVKKRQKQRVQESEGSDDEPFIGRGSKKEQYHARENVQSNTEENQPTRPPKRNCVLFREFVFPRGMSTRIGSRRMD